MHWPFFVKSSCRCFVLLIVLFSCYKLRHYLDHNLAAHIFDYGVSGRHHVTREVTKAQCRPLLTCLTNGSWALKKGLKSSEIEKRRAMDSFLLEYQGWPGKLSRADLKCGENFPPPSPPNRLKSRVSICEGNSENPCCNEEKNACGNISEYCDCELCTNFTKFLPAEISEWHPSSKDCIMEKLDHRKACEFLNKHISEIAFIGDSLTRHFFVALALLLTNNSMNGALRPDIDPKQTRNCQGEFQFIDGGKFNCHLLTAHDWDHLQNVCTGFPVKFKVHLNQAYNFIRFRSAKKTIGSLLNKTGSYVVMNVGLHMSLNSVQVIKDYVGPLVNLVARKGNGWPKIIWHDLHTIDNFLRSEINHIFSPWKKYNLEMAEYFKRKNIDVLQTSLLTKDIISYDYRHFGFGGNMMKVQILLNYLKNRLENCSGW